MSSTLKTYTVRKENLGDQQVTNSNQDTSPKIVSDIHIEARHEANKLHNLGVREQTIREYNEENANQVNEKWKTAECEFEKGTYREVPKKRWR